MKFVDKTYKRITVSRKVTLQAIVRIEQRDCMRVRRNPDVAAIIEAERLTVRNNGVG